MRRFNQLELEQLSLLSIDLLAHAEVWRLREEVENEALKIMEGMTTPDPEQAIIWAYEDWIK